MKKKLLSFMVIMVLVVSFCATGFASSGDGGTAEIVPQETDNVLFSINRTSATSASVGINVHFSQKVDSYSVVVYLQKYSNGKWVLDTQNDDYVYFNNGLNAYSFSYHRNYDDLKRGTSYRIQCISKDYIDDSSHIFVAYSPIF